MIDIYNYYQRRVDLEARKEPLVKPWEDRQMFEFIDKFYTYRTAEKYNDHFDVDGYLRPAVFDRVFSYVDLSKVPGSPLVAKVTTNREMLPELLNMNLVVEWRLNELEKLGKRIWENKSLMYTQDLEVAYELVRSYVSDPVLVTIKGEARAVEDGKRKVPRLVSQVSLLKNLEQRILFMDSLIEEQRHKGIPTSTQLDIITPEETDALWKELNEHGPLSTSDVQGWEYSVNVDDRWRSCFKRLYTMKVIEFSPVKCNIVINKGKEKHFYTTLGHYFTMIYRVVQLPTGELLVPPPGQMSSGELLTFSDNSFMRSDLANRAAIRLGKPLRYVRAAGDDCLDSNEDATEIYKSFGKKITDFFIQEDVFNFCSTTFTQNGAWQDGIYRACYSLLMAEDMFADRIRSFKECFSRHPDYENAVDFLVEQGFAIDGSSELN